MEIRNWPLPTVTADTETDLVNNSGQDEFDIKGILVCNYSGSSADIEIKLTNQSNVLKAQIYKNTLSDSDTLFIDTPISMDREETDKIRVLSNQVDVSFLASGDVN